MMKIPPHLAACIVTLAYKLLFFFLLFTTFSALEPPSLLSPVDDASFYGTMILYGIPPLCTPPGLWGGARGNEENETNCFLSFCGNIRQSL